MTFQMFAVCILLKRVNWKMVPPESIKFLFISDSQWLVFQVVTEIFKYASTVGAHSFHTYCIHATYLLFVTMLIKMDHSD